MLSAISAQGQSLLADSAPGYGDIDQLNIKRCGKYTNLLKVSITPPDYGVVAVRASGQVHFFYPDRKVVLGIKGPTPPIWAGSGLSNGEKRVYAVSLDEASNGYGYKSFALQRTYPVEPGRKLTFYLKACRDRNTEGTIYWDPMTVEYMEASNG